MRLIGLTGGIASGKTTVARMFADAGCPVIDADAIAREVVAPGTPALAAISRRWPWAMRPDGTLDRSALARIIFADAGARAELDAIVTHPIVERTSQRAAELAATGAKVAIYDAALVVEKGLDRGLDGLVVVSVPEEVQVERLSRRDGLPGDEARARLAAQLPLTDKLRRATWVIDNAGSLEETRAQVARIWAQIQEKA